MACAGVKGMDRIESSFVIAAMTGFVVMTGAIAWLVFII
jgi:hypothetical protein